MTYEFIKLEKSDRIATLTLNRPAKMNALSTGLLQEFSDALDDVHNDHDINVLILTGEGRAFSAGYDISPGQDAPDIPATAAWDAKHLSARTLMKLWHLRQPTIAAVNGFALAAGNVLAMTADIVIAADNATFGEPEIRFVAHSPGDNAPLHDSRCAICTGSTTLATPSTPRPQRSGTWSIGSSLPTS